MPKIVKWAASLIIIMILGAFVYYYFDNRSVVKTDKKAAQETTAIADHSGTKTNLAMPGNPVRVPVIADGKIASGKEIKSRELIESSSTVVYLPNEIGTQNASVACQIVTGYNDGGGFVLKSGEVFSADMALGERTLQRGFQYGNVPVRNSDGTTTIIKSIASGICRWVVGMATSASRAGLDTATYPFTKHLETPHYLYDSRNKGLVDATIWHEGGIDCKFINNKPFDIQINCGVDSSYRLWVKFYKITYKT